MSAERVGDVLVSSMYEGGVDAIFFTSGSDITFFQEVFGRQIAENIPGPRLFTMVHESTALNAALGYAAVSHRPAATAAHVDVGTLNYGAAIHSAARARLPVLLMAGTPPISMPGRFDGGRDDPHFWTQQVPDQNGIVRQYMKWEHRLDYHDDGGAVVSRALQIALSEPRGPVYLSIPREVAWREAPAGAATTLGRMGVQEPTYPPPGLVDEIIERLRHAQRPVVIAGRSGRTSGAAAALSRFVERFGVLVLDGTPLAYQPIAFDHELYLARGSAQGADLVIALECDVPWMPGRNEPADDAFVVFVDPDPISRDLTVTEFRADARVSAGALEFLESLNSRAEALLDVVDDAPLAARRQVLGTFVADERKTRVDGALRRRRDDGVDSLWAAHVVGEWLSDGWLIMDDTGSSSAPVRSFLRMSEPDRYFRHPSTAGGWGPGAAIGAKLAAPQADVALISGEGFYMFGIPAAALWAANEYDAPFLTIIFQNNSYNTGTKETARHFPGGYAQRADFPGGKLRNPVDLAALCESFGGHGENVTSSARLADALDEAATAVRRGRCALVAIQIDPAV